MPMKANMAVIISCQITDCAVCVRVESAKIDRAGDADLLPAEELMQGQNIGREQNIIYAGAYPIARER